MAASAASPVRLSVRTTVTTAAISAAGLALVLIAAWQLLSGGLHGWLPQLAMMSLVVAAGELRPMVMSRMPESPVSIAVAFVFATLFLWGLWPALLLLAMAVLISEVLVHKPVQRTLFNIGQYVLSLCAGWLVMLAADVRPTLGSEPMSMDVTDLWWVLPTWAVFHLTNLALVALVAEQQGLTWWQSFSDEFWYYTVSTFAVLALSPLVAVVTVASSLSWTLLPLLLLPLAALQQVAEMTRRVEQMALQDALTGLPNRRLLQDRLARALARSNREGGQVVLFFLDLDLFKVVNEGLGHTAGDDLLRELACRLSSVLRSTDTLARTGGDEFAIVCEGLNDHAVAALTDRISDCLREPYKIGPGEVMITASIGIAHGRPGVDADTMLRDADAAMYRAKAGGRDQATHFRTEMRPGEESHLETAAHLHHALARGELRARYQPIVEVSTGRILGFEALMRWEHPQRGLLGPDSFISIAEQTGLILPLGSWILNEALGQLRKWQEAHLGGLWVSVNLSARQLRDPRLAQVVSEALRTHDIAGERLHLEITETVIMDSLEANAATLQALRELGVNLGVDDFGTGYSSLSYLRALPVSMLKIDRSFTERMVTADSSDLSIVQAIVNMAAALDLGVIAEGVERPEQLEMLRELGVFAAQGFLWSPAIKAEDVTVWLQTAPDLAAR